MSENNKFVIADSPGDRFLPRNPVPIGSPNRSEDGLDSQKINRICSNQPRFASEPLILEKNENSDLVPLANANAAEFMERIFSPDGPYWSVLELAGQAIKPVGCRYLNFVRNRAYFLRNIENEFMIRPGPLRRTIIERGEIRQINRMDVPSLLSALSAPADFIRQTAAIAGFAFVEQEAIQEFDVERRKSHEFWLANRQKKFEHPLETARECQTRATELMRFSFIASVAFTTHPQPKQKINFACELDELLEAIHINIGSDQLEQRFGFFSSNPYDLMAPRLAQMNLAEIRFKVPADPRMRLRENARLAAARYLEIERRALDQLARENGLNTLIFFLKLADLEAEPDPKRLFLIAIQRQDELEKYRVWPAPVRFAIDGDRFIALDGNTLSPGEWKGFSVGKKALAAGCVHWIRSPSELKGDFDGKIIACESLFPELTIVYGKCAGIVCASGGFMAHAAVVAREMNVVCVCQTPGLNALQDGQWVTVDGTNGRIRLSPQKGP